MEWVTCQKTYKGFKVPDRSMTSFEHEERKSLLPLRGNEIISRATVVRILVWGNKQGWDGLVDYDMSSIRWPTTVQNVLSDL